VVDALEHADSLDPAVWSEMVAPAGGIDVLAAPDHPYGQPIDHGRLHDLIEYSRTVYDWTVVDMPSIFHRVSLLALSEADKAYLVSTSDLASLHLARRALGLLAQLGFSRDRYEVVVNRLGRRDGIGGSEIEKIFNCPVHSTLPNDYFSLHRVISLGQPLAGDCELGRAIGAMASRVCSPPAERRPAPSAEARPATPES
jgi:Flp pilus assembly CpaE family ATPase